MNDITYIQLEGLSGDQWPTSVTLGRRLAAVRRARGMTQRQVAEQMKISKARVSHIEQGRVSSQDVIARYANALGGRLHQAIYFRDGKVAAIV
nr:helix-turn-helix transcriptional regulator [uncultured Actinoplanes sp.]